MQKNDAEMEMPKATLECRDAKLNPKALQECKKWHTKCKDENKMMQKIIEDRKMCKNERIPG